MQGGPPTMVGGFPLLPWVGAGILYFIVYITVCRGWGGVVVMYTIENQHLHLGGGASEKEDSASPREDKILPRTCICFFHRHRRYPTAKH